MTPLLLGPKQKQTLMGGQSLRELQFTSNTDPLLQSQPFAGSASCFKHKGDFFFFLASVQCACKYKCLMPS